MVRRIALAGQISGRSNDTRNRSATVSKDGSLGKSRESQKSGFGKEWRERAKEIIKGRNEL
jgi:hypothetical protein